MILSMNLDLPVSKLPTIGPAYAKRLNKLDITTLGDLLYHVPHRYNDFRTLSPIREVQPEETVTIKGTILSIKNIYTRYGKKIQIGEVEDKSGLMQVVWFNQPYLIKNISKGGLYSFSGKATLFNRKITLMSPEYESVEIGSNNLHTGRLVPIYPETARVSSKWLRGKIFTIINLHKSEISDPLPDKLLKKLKLPDLYSSLLHSHFPDNLEQAEIGKKRLAFDELLYHQVSSLDKKNDWQKVKVAKSLNIDNDTFDMFLASLPFSLTDSQKHAVKEIFSDLSKSYPMNRLLEGDVGSGKTAVAAAAAFAAFTEGYQSVFMAPTQILANQHFNTLNTIFAAFKVRISLITSEGVKADLGKSDIIVGTHALIHKKVKFDKVALVVIDEQHRFGVEQRAHLIKKAGDRRTSPHVLTLTATPIPRTVALTFYGDLDLSTLDELPGGRRPITTWIVPQFKRNSAYDWIKKQIKEFKTQAFVICPLIEEPQIETMKQIKAATREYEKLTKIFKDYHVGLLHGKQKAKDKNLMLDKFSKGDIEILVSTPVVEVGIDIPNATIMIIEASERFGLAQLHQLRGRIGRGEKKSYCLLFTENTSRLVRARLKALKENKSGFELAELDLKLRGPGEIFGTRQHGFHNLKIANWQDIYLIKKAKEIAKEVISNPNDYRQLIAQIKSKNIVPN